AREARRRSSRVVDVGRRNGEDDGAVLELPFADPRLRARSLQLGADLFRELLDKVRAGVVPRLRVSGTGIAETEDHVVGARAPREHYSEDSAASPSGAA